MRLYFLGTTVVLDAAPDKDTGLSSGQKVMLVLCPFTAYAWMLIIMACVLVSKYALYHQNCSIWFIVV